MQNTINYYNENAKTFVEGTVFCRLSVKTATWAIFGGHPVT